MFAHSITCEILYGQIMDCVCRNWQNESHWRNEQRPIGERDENIGFPVSGLITGWRWFVRNIASAPFLCPSTPYDSFFLSRRGSFVSINNVSLRVSLAKQTLLFSTRIRFHRFFFREVSYGRTEMGLRYNFMRYAPIVINGVHMKHLKTVDLHFSFALLEKKWISWKFI